MPPAPFPAEQLALLFDRTAYTRKAWQPQVEQLTQWVLVSLSHGLSTALQVHNIEVSVNCVDSEAIRALNLEYRSKDSATNVLSFPADMPPIPADEEGAAATVVLGDVVISPDVLEIEAIQQDKSLEHHWAHMVIHSVLHLNGFDHQDEIQAEAMESLEIQILSTLGITNPYLATSAK